MMLATSSPSVLWYITRGTGSVLLIVLSASLALGILTFGRWQSKSFPRFVTVTLHRNLALFSIVLLAIHMLTAILDPFAHLGLKDALIPFSSAYRPLWLGIGVVSGEIMVAIAATSLVRVWLHFRLWKGIHLLSYLSWPLAVFHGLGTGSDARHSWFLWLTAACVTLVVVSLIYRVSLQRTGSAERKAATFSLSVGVFALILWTITGPLQSDWAVRAGTPSAMLPHHASQTSSHATPTATPTPSPRSGGGIPVPVTAELQGVVQENTVQGGAFIDVVDRQQQSLRFGIKIASPTSTTFQMEVLSNGSVICSTTGTIQPQTLLATCGTTQVTIGNLQVDQVGNIQGILQTTVTS